MFIIIFNSELVRWSILRSLRRSCEEIFHTSTTLSEIKVNDREGNIYYNTNNYEKKNLETELLIKSSLNYIIEILLEYIFIFKSTLLAKLSGGRYILFYGVLGSLGSMSGSPKVLNAM